VVLRHCDILRRRTTATHGNEQTGQQPQQDAYQNIPEVQPFLLWIIPFVHFVDHTVFVFVIVLVKNGQFLGDTVIGLPHSDLPAFGKHLHSEGIHRKGT
jgi:hypothetical protein